MLNIQQKFKLKEIVLLKIAWNLDYPFLLLYALTESLNKV